MGSAHSKQAPVTVHVHVAISPPYSRPCLVRPAMSVRQWLAPVPPVVYPDTASPKESADRMGGRHVLQSVPYSASGGTNWTRTDALPVTVLDRVR